MHDALTFFIYFTFSQMITAVIFLCPFWNKNQSVRFFILFMLCCVGFLSNLVFPSLVGSELFDGVRFVLMNSLPGLFWLVGLSVFGERYSMTRWHYFIASLTLLIPLTSISLQFIFSFDLTNFEAFDGVVTYGALILELSLVSHALIIGIKHWRDDLVPERRCIRGGVIGSAAIYIFITIIIEQLLLFDWVWLEWLKYTAMAILTGTINFYIFTIRDSSLFDPIVSRVALKDKVQQVSKELSSVLESMTETKLYQQEGITISVLAKHLAIHEYRLRQLINGELGYRNFNDFLNYYRIDEISQKLAQPELRQMPVLTMALESGFRSLSSFNKSFKSIHGVTPTEYRKSCLAG